jgi:uncharacterized protein YecE (DUF72 family)
MAYWVGTSGYTYPEWRGTFYPERFPAAQMLGYYAARFPTVEINYTFYRMPAAKTVAGWEAGTPPNFAFALKAPQRMTHLARLRDVDEPLRYFLETVCPLGPKLGPLLFQLPPSFRKDVSRLGDVLALLPPGLRSAFEFRHPSWFSEDVYDLLRGRGAALCVADTEDGTTPLEGTGTFGYFRLRDVGYTDADLARWGERILALGAAWQDTFVYFKHEESGTGPRFATELRARLGA